MCKYCMSPHVDANVNTTAVVVAVITTKYVITISMVPVQIEIVTILGGMTIPVVKQQRTGVWWWRACIIL